MRTAAEEKDLADNYIQDLSGVWVHKDSLKPPPPPPVAPKAAPARAATPAAAPYVSKYWKQEFVDKHGDRTITYRKLDRILGDLLENVAAIFKNYRDQIIELKKAVEELKIAPTKTLADAFRGGWQPNTHYTRGSLVVKDGALWLAMAEASTKPGSSDEWRLVTKAGKDGKDLVR